MENNTVQKIGLFITGRNPGFEKFVKINWSGDEPGDIDNKTGPFAGFHNPVEPKAPYYASELGTFFTTYECTLPNFLGSDGRISDFRYYLRIPADYQIETQEGTLCSPFYLINEVRKLVEGSTLKDAAGFWKIDLGNGFVPQWDTEGLKAVLEQFRLKHTWGNTFRNTPAPAPAGYDTSDPVFYGMHVNSLPFMRLNETFSKIFFGKIPTMENLIQFPSGLVLPDVYLRIKSGDSLTPAQQLTAGPCTVTSVELGYPASSFEEIKVSLTAEDVLNAYNNNSPLPLPEGVSYKLDDHKGEIILEFTPRPLTQIIKVAVSGVSASEQEALLADLSFCGEPLGKSIMLSGLQIDKFLEMTRQPGFSARFALKSGSDFTFKNALFKDNVIYITADKPKPRRNTPAPPHPKAGSVSPLACEVRITLPASEKAAKYPVSVLQKTKDGTDMCFMSSIEFAAKENNGPVTGTILLPLGPSDMITVEVGAPARFESEPLGCNNIKDESYYDADFSGKSGKGILSRFLSTIGFKQEPYMSSGFKAARWLLVLIVLFWLFIGGCATGILCYDSVSGFISEYFLDNGI